MIFDDVDCNIMSLYTWDKRRIQRSCRSMKNRNLCTRKEYSTILDTDRAGNLTSICIEKICSRKKIFLSIWLHQDDVYLSEQELSFFTFYMVLCFGRGKKLYTYIDVRMYCICIFSKQWKRESLHQCMKGKRVEIFIVFLRLCVCVYVCVYS